MTKAVPFLYLVEVDFRSKRTLSAGMAAASSASKQVVQFSHNLLPVGSSAHAPADSLSVQKTSAIPAGVAVFHSNPPTISSSCARQTYNCLQCSNLGIDKDSCFSAFLYLGLIKQPFQTCIIKRSIC